MDRAPGLSVRLKLTLSYAGFIMLVGALLLAAVWVDPAASDAAAVSRNTRAATAGALAAGRRRAPELAEVLAARERPENPFFRQ